MVYPKYAASPQNGACVCNSQEGWLPSLSKLSPDCVCLSQIYYQYPNEPAIQQRCLVCENSIQNCLKCQKNVINGTVYENGTSTDPYQYDQGGQPFNVTCTQCNPGWYVTHGTCYKPY